MESEAGIMYQDYAAIGARDLTQFPQWLRDLYCESVHHLVRLGFRIRTGAAVGSDQLAAESALVNGGRVLLHLPWRRYELAWIEEQMQLYPGKIGYEYYNPPGHQDWTEAVPVYHPNPGALTRGAFCLQARNWGIMKGCKGCIALPGNKTSGTRTAMAMARGQGVPVFDLTDLDTQARLRQAIDARIRKEMQHA